MRALLRLSKIYGVYFVGIIIISGPQITKGIIVPMPKCAMIYPYALTGSETLGAGICSADLHDPCDRIHHTDPV